MKNKNLLAIILIGLSLCSVSIAAYGETYRKSGISALTATREECLLLCAKADYIMGNPISFLDIDVDYDPYGHLGNLMKWPVKIDARGKVVVRIRDSKNVSLNKSGVHTSAL